MKVFEKPKILISKCLGQGKCRYDGSVIHSGIIEGLSPFVEFITVCPEMEIGLPVPRESLRIIRNDKGEDRLVFSMSGTDKTEDMETFAKVFFSGFNSEEIDGVILKHRSPSCGMNDVKVYKGCGKSPLMPLKTTGFFGREVIKSFPNVPVENEGRLLHYNLREHFMIRIFIMKDFKRIVASGKISELMKFHQINKYLLMAFNQKQLSSLGKIVANHNGQSFEQLIGKYEENLVKAIEQPLSVQRNINVLLHVFGYFKKNLTNAEKAFFLEEMELYHQKRIPFSAMISILKAWVIRFDEPYLREQTFFEPFPATLFEVADSGKGL